MKQAEFEAVLQDVTATSPSRAKKTCWACTWARR
jgi:hypothetical protein